MLQPVLEFVVIGDDVAAARQVAREHGGKAYADERADSAGLPFRTLVRVVTDTPSALASAASIGTYVVCTRPQKVRAHPPDKNAVVQINAMVAAPNITRDESDAHWREVHAPLARRVHIGMSNYTQLSVVHTIAGPNYAGFALVEFENDADFRERFYSGPEGRQEVMDDIVKFADLKVSPRRLVARRIV